MTKVCLVQWYNINNAKDNGYELYGINTERCYFESASKQQCIDYALAHNMQILYEA